MNRTVAEILEAYENGETLTNAETTVLIERKCETAVSAALASAAFEAEQAAIAEQSKRDRETALSHIDAVRNMPAPQMVVINYG